MSRFLSALAVLLLMSAWACAQVAPIAPEGRLKRILDTNTIRIAYRTDAAPFASEDVDKKEPVGYSIDLCRKVAESVQQQLKIPVLRKIWVPVTTQNRFDVVARGKADMECGSTTVTLTRMKIVSFSSIIFVDHTALLVKKSNPAKGIDDFSGRKIGVIAGTSNEGAINFALEARELKGKVGVVVVANRDEGLAKLDADAIDAFASDRLLLVGLAGRSANPEALALLTESLSFEPYAIVLPRGDWALRLAVNTALAQTYRTGAIEKIHDDWFGKFGKMSPLMAVVYQLGALPE